MNDKQHNKFDKSNNGGRNFVRGILTYGSLQPILFSGAVRVDRSLREQAKTRKPRARRSRRQPEVIYQWDLPGNSFRMRLYTSVETESLVTRAQRTGHAKLRLTIRDSKSKQVARFVSGSVELERDETGWEQKVKNLLDRAFLFISRKRPICPLCRNLMEIRTGERGDFWGCEEFPACRGTRNIPEAFREYGRGVAGKNISGAAAFERVRQ